MARQFTGSEDLNIGIATPLQITGDKTISFRIKTTTIALQVLLGFYKPSGSFEGYGVAIGISIAGRLNYFSNVTGSWRQSSTGINNGAWRHCAIRINGTGAGAGTFYLDGTADGTFTEATCGVGGAVKRIAANADATLRFIGEMAEVAVYSAALDASEITALSKGFSPILIRPASLVAYWPLIGSYSPEIDVWKNNLSGTITGSPSASAHPRVYYPTGQMIMPITVLPIPPVVVNASDALYTHTSSGDDFSLGGGIA